MEATRAAKYSCGLSSPQPIVVQAVFAVAAIAIIAFLAIERYLTNDVKDAILESRLKSMNDEEAIKKIRECHGPKAEWLLDRLIGIYNARRKQGDSVEQALKMQNKVYLQSVGVWEG